MLADELPITEHPGRGVAQWFFDRAAYELSQSLVCCWWALRAHTAARHGIPRSCLEDPPAEWLRVLGSSDQDL